VGKEGANPELIKEIGKLMIDSDSSFSSDGGFDSD